jgi:hypothetical protein
MRLIGLAVVLAVSLTLVPLAGGAQQAEKVRRIGFLSGTNPNSEVDDALGGPVPESPCKLKGLSHT